MKEMQGYNVLHPMGWDAFGLPAEQYAIKTGNHPETFTKKKYRSILKNKLKSLGLFHLIGINKFQHVTQIFINGLNGFLSNYLMMVLA